MTPAQQQELAGLAFEIADSTAMSDIESFCDSRVIDAADHRWYDTGSPTGEFEREAVDRAVRYLDLQGKLAHRPENPALVRRKKAGSP